MDYSNLNIPKHVAIVLDGNGRWAKERNLNRSEGHYAGFNNLDNLSKYIFSKGIEVLSVYAFSTENFKRSKEEVDYLMNLFAKGFNKYVKNANKYNYKIVFSGRRELLPDKVLKMMDEVTIKTKDNGPQTFNICVNYGGQYEILDAFLKLHNDINNNLIDIKDINLDKISNYMYQALPPVDLMIRTSGELRLSNFLLWQNAYAEFYFPKVYFPDFNENEFDKAIIEYNKRNRRFGGIKDESKSD